jgi:hypothetical protein
MEEFEAVDEETGKPLYIKLTKNADGEMVVGETTDPNEEGCTGQRVMRFGARYEAGLWYAIKDLTTALADSKNRSEKLRELFSNEAKTASLKNGL